MRIFQEARTSEELYRQNHRVAHLTLAVSQLVAWLVIGLLLTVGWHATRAEVVAAILVGQALGFAVLVGVHAVYDRHHQRSLGRIYRRRP